MKMPFFKIWNRRSKILLLENIEMYISSGLALNNALSTAAVCFKDIQQLNLLEVNRDIKRGYLFSKSINKHLTFSPSIVGLIEQGERSGSLPQSLALARSILEREEALIKTCTGALTYPAVILIFAGILTLGLMRGVMPQIIPLLKSLHVTLPLMTRIAMYLSEHILIFSLYTLAACVVCIPPFILLYNRWYLFRFKIHQIILQVPLIGELFKYYSLSVLLRSFGSLVLSGMHITESYRYAIERITLLPFKKFFEENTDQLSQGSTLFSVFSKMKRIPVYIPPLIGAGEASGTLGASIVRSADILDRDIERSLKSLTALIEPVMMIGIGCIVGSIALSIMMPIYDVSKTLQH